MPAPEGEAAERGQDAKAALMGELRLALHDLCQPLSALQCRLYLGGLDDDPASMREAIAESLVECERMVDQVRLLQDKVKS